MSIHRPQVPTQPHPATPSPDFFVVARGNPTDTCPLCGILRRHAGNPDACTPANFGQPNCFASGRGLRRRPRRRRP